MKTAVSCGIAGLLLVCASNAAVSSIALDPASAPGKIFGTFSVSFSLADWNGDEISGGWGNQMGSWETTYKNLESDSEILISLRTLSESPGELYVYGAIIPEKLDGIAMAWVDGDLIGGGGGGIFKPGVASIGLGISSHSSSGDWVGFAPSGELAVMPYEMSWEMQQPWDPDASEWSWSGTWAVEWDSAIPEPSTTLITCCLLAFGIMIRIRRR